MYYWIINIEQSHYAYPVHIPHHESIARHQPHPREVVGRHISECSINNININISRKGDHVGNAKLVCKTLYREAKRQEPKTYHWPM